MNNILLIVNPKAGQGSPANDLLRILDAFSARHVPVTTYVTQCRGDGHRVACKAGKNYEVVACYGGDGTLDEVIAGLLDGGFAGTVGYIPAGSTNDFAYSLGLPGNAEEAAQIILEEHAATCDIGQFNDQRFVYVAAFGVFTEVSYKTDQNMKNALGHLAYVLEGAKSLFNIKSYAMRVETDDQVIEGKFVYGMICNSKSVGGFRNIAGDDVRLDDGLFELVLVRDPGSVQGLDRIIGSLTAKKSDGESVYFLKSRTFRITAEQPVPWTLDGEDGGEHETVCAENKHHAVKIFVKNDAKQT